MYLLSSFLLLFVVAATAGGGGHGPSPAVQWTIQPAVNNPPPQRGAGRMDYIQTNPLNRNFYIFGGFDECFNGSICDHVWTNELWRYSFQTKRWTNMNPTPDPVYGVPAERGFLGSDVYDPFFGETVIIYYAGAKYNAPVTVRTWYDDMWEYRPSSNSWRKRVPTTAVQPSSRLGPSIVIHLSTLYMFGGISASFQFLNDLWSYNLLTDVWTQIIASNPSDPSLPPANFGPQLQKTTTGPFITSLIMFGGNIFPPGSGNQNEEIWKYSFLTNSWSKYNPTPAVPGANVGRVHGASAYKNNKFIIALGDKDDAINECQINLPSAGQLPTNGTWYFHEPSKTWNEVTTTMIPKLKRIYYDAKGSDTMYVWGGFGFTCVNQVDVVTWNFNIYKLDIGSI
jgi:hypothetical protein